MINIQLPRKQSLKPQITVFGVGGAGCNAVNNMINSNMEGAEFIVANTDSQSLENSPSQKKLQLGMATTHGLGAGSYPEVGKAAAEESMDEIKDHLQGSNMVFITAGMGGGTGTGAAPVIARAAKEMGILTVSVVTKPFHFEGSHRMRVAELGLQELQKFVDTLIVIPNQNLFRVADKSTTFADAFRIADDVLHSGVRSVTDLMIVPGLINLDFADVRSVMSGMGRAMMGTGEAEGERRALDAAEAAISNPLLDNTSMQGARGVLINITGGADMTLFEVDEAANRVREEVDNEANIIFGSTFNNELKGKIRVSVVATGIENGFEQKPSAFFQKTEVQIKPNNQTSSFGNIKDNMEDKKEDEIREDEFFQEINNTNEIDPEEFVVPEPVEPDFSAITAKPRINMDLNSSQQSIFEIPVKQERQKNAERPTSRFSIFNRNSKSYAASQPDLLGEGNSKPSNELELKTEVRETSRPSHIADNFDVPTFMRKKK